LEGTQSLHLEEIAIQFYLEAMLTSYLEG
jgi:hypothetical protein